MSQKPRSVLLETLAPVLNAVVSGIVVLDRTGCVVYVNDAAGMLLGCAACEVSLVDLRVVPSDPAGEAQADLSRIEAAAGDFTAWSSVISSGGVDRAVEFAARWTPDDVDGLLVVTLHDISDQRASVRQAAAISRIAESMTYAGSLEASLHALAQGVLHATGVGACTVLLVDEQLRPTIAGAASTRPDVSVDCMEEVETFRQAGARPPWLRAVDERRPLVIDNYRELCLSDPRAASMHVGLKVSPWDVMACVPLMYRGRPLGVLVGHFEADSAPNDAEIKFLTAIAAQTAVAVQNALLAAEAQEAAAGHERRLAEDAVRESEAQYRAVFGATSDGMCIADANGRLVEFNAAAVRLLGRTLQNASTSGDPLLLPETMDTVRRDGSARRRVTDTRDDGTSLQLDARVTEFTFRGEPHFLVVMRDITEQVAAYDLLEQRVAERTRELSTLLQISHNVASTLELQPLLGLILDQLKVVADYSDAGILEVAGNELRAIGYRGPLPDEIALALHFPIEPRQSTWPVIVERKTLIIPDVRGDSPQAQQYRDAVGDDLNSVLRFVSSFMAVPMILRDRVIGALSLSHGTPNYYTDRHASLVRAIANQAAVAIDNARLFARSRDLAALEERQRLARELHDSVSQALYGIGLGARTARALIDTDPKSAVEPLEYVLAQAEAGLTEMRALIFELRPEALETEGLVAALHKQAEVLRARQSVAVELEALDEPDVPYVVKEALYRIAQEALNNAAKHARANTVRVRLSSDPNELTLDVEDDGRGFDVDQTFTGHLGLRAMSERALRLGRPLLVHSEVGRGTTIRVRVPAGTRDLTQAD